jgi:hypothetical protein
MAGCFERVSNRLHCRVRVRRESGWTHPFHFEADGVSARRVQSAPPPLEMATGVLLPK